MEGWEWGTISEEENVNKMKVLLVLSLALVVASIPVVALADGPAMPDLGPINEYVAAVGVGTLIAILVEILKRLGAVPDGQAGVWVAVGNVVAFAGLYIAGVFGLDVMGDLPQQVLGILEQVGKLILMFLSAVGSFKAARAANVLKPLKSRKF